jgi:hypothetical protein
MIAAFGIYLRAQDKTGSPQTSYVDDWTHHHLVFSNPGTREDAVKNGTLEKWQKVNDNTRYQMQQGKRAHGDRTVHADRGDRGDDSDRDHHKGGEPAGKTVLGIAKDWNTPLGSSSSATLVLTIGTPSGSTISGTSTLTLDGVAFDAGSPTAETAIITFSGSAPSAGATVTIGSIVYTFSTVSIGSAPASGCTVYSATGSTGATSLYQAITNTGTQGGTNYRCVAGYTANAAVTATHTGGSSTINLTSVTTGTTGFTFSRAGTTGFTTFTSVAGTWGVTNGAATPPTFAYLTGATMYVTASVLATNIATAIDANATTSAALTATANSPASGNITITANAGSAGNSISASVANFTAVTGAGSLSGGTTATVQPNAAPAKYGASLTAADCTNDFVAYPTGQPGASGAAANIIAYHNMYTTGCTGTVPSVYWAYNTGTGSTVTTSPIISVDGTKIAFIQSNGTTASLVVVKWASSTTDSISSPETLATSTNITACTAPCMTVTNLTSDDTLSAPFYDLITDSIYVGDDNGSLEKFTGVFYGTAVTAITPVALGHTYPLASPVFDLTSGCVFVGDTQGYLYKANSGRAGSVCSSTTFSANVTSAILGNGSSNQGIFDGVLVDSTAETVYAFVTASAAIGNCTASSNCVAEFPASFAAAASPNSEQRLGGGNATYSLYAGTFDNVYFTLANGTGNLYAVGPNNINTAAALIRIPVATGGVMSTPGNSITGITSSSGTRSPWPSPVTEFCNGTCTVSGGATTSGTDYVLFSVYHGAAAGCTNSSGNGCILSYNVSNPASVAISNTGLNVTSPVNPGCWATGAIVIDNSAALTGASQIYFVNLNGAAAGGLNGTTSSGCTTGTGVTLNAVQAPQSNP